MGFYEQVRAAKSICVSATTSNNVLLMTNISVDEVLEDEENVMITSLDGNEITIPKKTIFNTDGNMFTSEALCIELM